MDKHDIASYFQGLQDTICAGIASTDGVASFKEDNWKRAEGGGGRTRVLAKGAILEKAGVKVGKTPSETALLLRAAIK